MALSADQLTAMTALSNWSNSSGPTAQGRISAKDMELVTRLLVDAWALSAADAKQFRSTVHRSHNGMGDANQ